MESEYLDRRTSQWRDAATQRSVGDNSYKGLPIHAKPGLHEHVAEVIKNYMKPDAVAIDLAAGSGAMSARLTDAGFKISAADFVAENFRISDRIPFIKLDLNADFASVLATSFDFVVACEIIEHLENPWHFLRQCKTLLKPEGLLFLSTPNPDSPISKAIYLRKGHFAWFSEVDYQWEGHISPLHVGSLRHCATECGLEIIDLHTFGSTREHYAGNLKRMLLMRLIQLFDTTPAVMHGDIIVAVLKSI